MANKRSRDLAINAALKRLVLIRQPLLSEAEIQERTVTTIGEGHYFIELDAKPLAMVEILSEQKFSITLL